MTVGKNQRKNIIIEIVHWLSYRLLDHPIIFNKVRYLLAGNQLELKQFIQKNLIKYDCKTIADFCCGTGDFSEICPKDSLYFGWDINHGFIKYAAHKYKNEMSKQFAKANVLYSQVIYKKRFDCVLLISSVHHFSNEELKVMLPKIKKITRKLIIVADIIPNPPHLIQKFFVPLDRGRYIRPKEEKLSILGKYFNIKETQFIPVRTAVQMGITCEVNKK